jgi:hypothetical protein
MTKQLSRIAPWQAGKLFALVYFLTSFIFVIPMALIATVAPLPAGPGPKIGPHWYEATGIGRREYKVKSFL